EAAPAVFKNIAFKQHSLRILEFEQVLHDERPPRCAPYKTGLARLPDHGLKEIISTDLDVCRSSSGAPAAEQNVLSGRLEEIIHIFNRAARRSPPAIAQDLSVSAGAGDGDTMEVSEERVQYCSVGHPHHCNGSCGFILWRTVHPHPVKDQVVGLRAIVAGC